MTKITVTLRRIDGTDLDVVDAARVSFGKRSRWEFGPLPEPPAGSLFPVAPEGWQLHGKGIRRLNPQDQRLVRYLAEHGHWTPFAHVGAQLHLKMPIAVARQLAKHQVGGVVNEISRRYVDDPPEFYTPKEWRKRAENRKQGSSDETLSDDLQERINLSVGNVNTQAEATYSRIISDGGAPEQARFVLPQSTMTEWIWTGSLCLWARVWRLRSSEDAQAETREVARQIDKIMREHFPVSWKWLTHDFERARRLTLAEQVVDMTLLAIEIWGRDGAQAALEAKREDVPSCLDMAIDGRGEEAIARLIQIQEGVYT